MEISRTAVARLNQRVLRGRIFKKPQIRGIMVSSLRRAASSVRDRLQRGPELCGGCLSLVVTLGVS